MHSYLRCKLETGRTHQIRVHLKYLGSPILGDKQYGVKNKKFKGSISIIIAADEETTGFGTPAIIKYLKRKAVEMSPMLITSSISAISRIFPPA